jgi:O-antigen/teichoic acid export membrane protein
MASSPWAAGSGFRARSAAVALESLLLPSPNRALTRSRALTTTEAPEPIEIQSAGLTGQLRPVMLIKAAQVLSMVTFTVVAPRLLGPTRFGELAVILSMTSLWQTACTLGGRYVFGRFIPEYAARGDTRRVRAVFMHVLETRAAAALVAAPFLYLLLRRSLPEASGFALYAAAGGFLALTLATPLYNVFFGLNRLGLSMSRDAFGQFLLLGLLVGLGAAVSLERTALALLLTHLVVLAIGIVLCRRLFTFERSVFDLPSLLVHARFGLTVFGANLLLRLPWRLGETALALGGVDLAQIAFFNLALAATAAFTQMLGSATTLQIPALSLREAAGDLDGRDRGLGISLRYLTVCACVFVLVVLAAAPILVRTLLGEAYLGVLPNLSIVALAALAAPLIRTSLARAVVGIRLLRTAGLGVVAVASFAIAGVVLIPRYGAAGASIALVLANFAAAAAAVFQIRGTGVLHQARMPRQLAAAAAPAALLLIGGHGPLQAAVAAALYLLAVFALRLVDWRDLRRIGTAALLG